MEVTG
jgi:hypothetical protein